MTKSMEMIDDLAKFICRPLTNITFILLVIGFSRVNDPTYHLGLSGFAALTGLVHLIRTDRKQYISSIFGWTMISVTQFGIAFLSYLPYIDSFLRILPRR